MREVQSHEFWYGYFAKEYQVGFTENIANLESFVIRPFANGWESEEYPEDCISGTEATGWWVREKKCERPATKEEIQAWIDMWGMPKTFKGQPEYPLGEKDDKIPESAPVQPLPELIDPFTVDWKESDFEGETHAALKPDYIELPGGSRSYLVYDLKFVAKYGVKTGVLYPIVDHWNEEHNFVSYPGCQCLTYVGHLVPGSKVKEYEAAKAETQPTAHSAVTGITEDLLAKEYAEAKKKVKEAKERATAIREIIRLEGVIKKSAQCKAELTKKWIGGDK